jgi:hypothetical protein
MPALLRYDARKAREEEQRRVTVAQQEAGRAQAEERKLAKLKAREQKQALRAQQKEQRLIEREQKQALRAQQDEQRRKDRMARDASAMQALLRYEAAAKSKKAREAEERRLAKAKEREQLAEERRLGKIKEREQKELLARQQEDQRRRGREAQDQACLQAFERYKAAAKSREQKQLLARQKEDQRRREREARDRACLEALARHEAAAKVKKAQEAEEHKLAKHREAERRKALRDQEKELRQIEKRERGSAARAKKVEDELLRERVERQRDERSLGVIQRRVSQSVQEEGRRRNREQRDEAGARALQRHKANAVQAQKGRQEALRDGRVVAFDGILPSFLEEEHQYMKQASTDFPETITPSIQMVCMRAYQKAISDASRRLPCGLCGGLFQEDEVVSIGLQDGNLQYFLRRTNTAPDCCVVKDDMVSLCTVCSSATAKRAIPLLSAGNFVNCLFCQDYPEVLKNFNAVEEAFIARANIVGIFLKLTSGAKKGVSYRGSRGHSVAVKQDPSGLLKILPTRRLQDHTTITVSWDRGMPPLEENLARFCSVDKAKVLNALLWLCANNPVYKSVNIDYSVLDSWPDHHIPQEIIDAFITLGSEPGSIDAPVADEREGYATSLQGGLFENELDAEVDETEPGSILSRSFFSDLDSQDLHSTPATLASLQAILQERDSDGSTPNEEHTPPGKDDEGGSVKR